MTWYCYILKTDYEIHKNRTYNGSTNDLNRRLRQHNQEITGGARYTKKFGNREWYPYVVVKGFPDRKNALQCEWRINHPDNKRRTRKYCTPIGRIEGLNKVLKLEKWTSNSLHNNNELDLHIYILRNYEHFLTDLPDNVTLHAVDNIIDDID